MAELMAFREKLYACWLVKRESAHSEALWRIIEHRGEDRLRGSAQPVRDHRVVGAAAAARRRHSREHCPLPHLGRTDSGEPQLWLPQGVILS